MLHFAVCVEHAQLSVDIQTRTAIRKNKCTEMSLRDTQSHIDYGANKKCSKTMRLSYICTLNA